MGGMIRYFVTLVTRVMRYLGVNLEATAVSIVYDFFRCQKAFYVCSQHNL